MRLTFWISFFVLATLILLFQNFITLNIPWWDDFQGILSPVDILLSDTNLSEKFKILFSQNNEHRVVFDRLVLLLITILNQGYSDMKFLAMSGTILLISLAFLLILIGRKQSIPFHFLAIIPLLLFSAHNYEILQSLMVPYQIFAVLFFSFASFYLASIQSKLYWLVILSTLAIFSHGNGLLTIPIVGLILLLTRRNKAFVAWAIFSVSIVTFYFLNYQSPTWNENISPLEDPVASFLYFFEFLGSFSLAFVNLSDTLTHSGALKFVPTVFGLVLFVVFSIVFFKKYLTSFSLQSLPKRLTRYSTEIFFLACILFLFATGFMMALKRTGFPMSSRYIINSQLIFILLFIFSYDTVKLIFLRKSIVVISLLYFIISAFNYTSVALNFKNSLEADAENWKANEMWLAGYTSSSQTFNLNILLKDPIKNKHYRFPDTWLSETNITLLKKDSIHLNYSYDQSVLAIELEDCDRGLFENNHPFLVLLKSNRAKFLVNFDYQRNPLLTWVQSMDYFNDIIRAQVHTQLIPKGEYSISILKMGSKQLEEYPTSVIILNKNDFIKFEY